MKHLLSSILITFTIIGIQGCNENNSFEESNASSFSSIDPQSSSQISSKISSSFESSESSSEDFERLSWFATKEYSSIKNDSATYEINPDFDNCYAGVLNQIHKERYLLLINNIRELHDLHPLTYDNSFDEHVQNAAMVMTIAGELTHQPDETWKCFSESAYLGASKSNIAGGYKNYHDAIVAWLKDASSSTMGHRRWILAPNIADTAIGDTGYYAQKVIQPRVSFDGPEFVAFPYKEYPLFLVQPKNSYYVSADIKWTFSLSNISGEVFDNVTVKVNDEFFDHETNYDNYGIPNALIWTVPGVEANKKYNVEISTKHGTFAYYVILK